jgi:hypothetical protein
VIVAQLCLRLPKRPQARHGCGELDDGSAPNRDSGSAVPTPEASKNWLDRVSLIQPQRCGAGVAVAARPAMQYLLILIAAFSTIACYSLRRSRGGGQIDEMSARRLDPADIAVPAEFTIEVVAAGLTFPTSVAFDGAGLPHVVEAGYSYGEKFTARLLRIPSTGAPEVVAQATTADGQVRSSIRVLSTSRRAGRSAAGASFASSRMVRCTWWSTRCREWVINLR